MQELIRVADVLKRPIFREAQVICGNTGLQKMVRWVHILEVSDPRDMIHGGELVLTTGVGLKGNTRLLEGYVDALIAGGAAGLCMELGTAFREIPARLIKKWHGRDFPIIVFARQVRFVDITQDIHALILSRQHRISQIYHEQEGVEQLIDGVPESSTIFQALGLPYDATRKLTVAILHTSEQKSIQDGSPDRLTRRTDIVMAIRVAITSTYFHCALAVRQSEIIVLMSHTRGVHWKVDLQKSMKRLMETLSKSGVDSRDLRLSVGGSVDAASQIPVSYRQAKRVAVNGELMGRVSPTVTFFEDLGIYRWLWIAAESPESKEMIERDLAKVTQYDRDHHTQLTHTLRVYLDCDRSKQKTAEKLFIHRQTLYHRLRQLEKLVGPQLDDPVQRLSMHFALYAYGPN